MNEVEKLKRENAVLREALDAYAAGDLVLRMPARIALADADRIAAEPTDPTDAEVVDRWASSNWIVLYDLHNVDYWFLSLSEAAEWIVMQKEEVK